MSVCLSKHLRRAVQAKKFEKVSNGRWNRRADALGRKSVESESADDAIPETNRKTRLEVVTQR